MTGPKRYGAICSAKPLGETVSIRALNGLVFITYTFELFGRAGAVADQPVVPEWVRKSPTIHWSWISRCFRVFG